MSRFNDFLVSVAANTGLDEQLVFVLALFSVALAFIGVVALVLRRLKPAELTAEDRRWWQAIK